MCQALWHLTAPLLPARWTLQQHRHNSITPQCKALGVPLLFVSCIVMAGQSELHIHVDIACVSVQHSRRMLFRPARFCMQAESLGNTALILVISPWWSY